MTDLGADIAVSVNWPRLLGSDVISLFPNGILNAHCGDLPRYRGNACPNWALLNGETEIGLCIHSMVSGDVDAGPVVLRDYLAVSDETYITDVYEWLDARIPTLMVEAIGGLQSGVLAPEPQPADPALGLRCFPRLPDGGKIDWSLPTDRVMRLVRASSHPFSGAFAHLGDGRKVTVWRARIFDHKTPFCAVPGQVMLMEPDGPVIACGDGCIKLEDIELEGCPKAEAKAAVGRSVRARLF